MRSQYKVDKTLTEEAKNKMHPVVILVCLKECHDKNLIQADFDDGILINDTSIIGTQIKIKVSTHREKCQTRLKFYHFRSILSVKTSKEQWRLGNNCSFAAAAIQIKSDPFLFYMSIYMPKIKMWCQLLPEILPNRSPEKSLAECDFAIYQVCTP